MRLLLIWSQCGLPRVAEPVPQESEEVCGHQSRQNLLHDLDYVYDEAIILNFVVSALWMVKVLHDTEHLIIIDKVTKETCYSQQLQHHDVSKNICIGVVRCCMPDKPIGEGREQVKNKALVEDVVLSDLFQTVNSIKRLLVLVRRYETQDNL